MSGRDRRGKRDIDYSIFHSTGKKVDKVRDEMTDVREEKRVKEIQICDDLEEAFTLYALDDLETEDGVSEGLAYISDLGKEYRHIHIELKELLGEKPYAETYPESHKTLSRNTLDVTAPFITYTALFIYHPGKVANKSLFLSSLYPRSAAL